MECEMITTILAAWRFVKRIDQKFVRKSIAPIHFTVIIHGSWPVEGCNANQYVCVII